MLAQRGHQGACSTSGRGLEQHWASPWTRGMHVQAPRALGLNGGRQVPQALPPLCRPTQQASRGQSTSCPATGLGLRCCGLLRGPSKHLIHNTQHGGPGSSIHSHSAQGQATTGRGSSVLAAAGAGSMAAPFPPDGDYNWQQGQQETQHQKAPSGLSVLLSQLKWQLLQRFQPMINFFTLYREIIQRVAVTLGLLVVIRAGLYIPLPGLDLQSLPSAAAASGGERLVKALYGQAAALPGSLAELGISPSINASIIVTVVLAFPDAMVQGIGPLQRLKEARKEGRAGQAYITSWMNYLSVIFAVYLGLLKAVQLSEAAPLAGPWFVPLTALALVAGACIIQYCASEITAHGIGNGSSLVICTSIVTDYAEALHSVASRLEAGALGAGTLAALSGAYLVLAYLAVLISRTELRLPTVQYNRAALPEEGEEGLQQAAAGDPGAAFSAARTTASIRMSRRMARADYFPLPINSSGMMSVILAGALWYHFVPAGLEVAGLVGAHEALLSLQNSLPGLLVYGLLVFLMEFLPLGGINPKDVAEYLNTVSVGVKGVVPGAPTEEYISQHLTYCKAWGGLALGCLAMAAQVFDAMCMNALGASLSATSLLIIVGTILQSSRQVEALLEGPRLTQKLRREQELIQSLRSI